MYKRQQQFGGHVAEQLQQLRTVDQAAGVVGVVGSDAQADQAGGGIHGDIHGDNLPWRCIHAWTAKLATSSA